MQKYDISQPIHLKKGIYELNRAPNFNYQLNRVINWGLKHGMYAYEADSAYGYAQKLKLYDIAPIADKVTQDVLIIGANQDHFINYKLIGQEINMFPNAKSLSFRLFTDKEEAQNHCNVGNGKLVLDTIDSWLDSLKKRDKK